MPKGLSDLNGTRVIRPFGASTPMLVPSFSSRGFPAAQTIFQTLHLDLYGCCLLSAFDLAQGHIRADLLKAADLVVIDSGLYEVRSDQEEDLHGAPPVAGSWDRGQYRSWLASIPAAVDAVVVSYDHYGPLSEQIESAARDFACCSRAAGDFLMKPEAYGQLLRPTAFSPADLSTFAVLGATEKELGVSPLERCATLIKLRRALRAAGQDLPIHVFGAITPRAMLAYFLCGADIFDGLNWLRYDFTGEGIAPLADLPEEPATWGVAVAERMVGVWRRNLRALQHMQTTLRSLAATKDFSALCAALPWAEQVIQGVAAAWRTRAEVR